MRIRGRLALVFRLRPQRLSSSRKTIAGLRRWHVANGLSAVPSGNRDARLGPCRHRGIIRRRRARGAWRRQRVEGQRDEQRGQPFGDQLAASVVDVVLPSPTSRPRDSEGETSRDSDFDPTVTREGVVDDCPLREGVQAHALTREGLNEFANADPGGCVETEPELARGRLPAARVQEDEVGLERPASSACAHVAPSAGRPAERA